ncbi:PLP-dependent aminotransferase family protein [Marinomonas transparens]|uniref:PLP-dependent aminotransferase family protein n=1 Tax=Marinomonas transparens TaxID=2795388 RepID=A0A934JML8_9GAMM|nr:PLP-dependent aminotransferase family protein [Marinomonas transparens]MBJ7536313.1 PLP-dependent aminotransferase family protein [Marinomonas transparens]
MRYAIASLRLSLDENGAPYYQQLMTQIQQGIVSGELSVGDKLPSSRFLAGSLGVSRSTTSRAYDQLIAEGILTSKEKRGVFVAALPMVRTSLCKRDLPVKNKSTVSETDVLAFNSGVDASVFPTKEWAASMRRSWLKPDLKVLNGSYSTGYPELKEAIVDYLYRVRGLECTADQIIVTAGNRDSLMLIQHALSSLLGSISWWLESPTYPPFREIIVSNSETQVIEINEEGPCLPMNEHGACVGIVTPNRQYPLGVSISVQRRQQWVQKLQEESSNWWLVEDDYDNEFVYQGRSDVPFMQTASFYEKARDRVFFVGSFSKVLFRGLRLGFVVAPLSQIELLHKSQNTLGSSTSLPIQPVVADFMLQGNFDRHLNRMRRHYRMKRDSLLALLENELSTWFDWKKTRGGMHVLIEFKPHVLLDLSIYSNIDLDQHIAHDMLSQKVYLSALSLHYDDSSIPRQGFVLGFSGPTQETMSHAIKALRSWFLEHQIRKGNV